MRRRIPSGSPGCVLRGVFLGRPHEVDWFLHGMAAIFPDAHAQFVGFLPEDERGDILGAYLRRLTDPDPSVHLPAARAWSVYEGSCSTLLPSPETVSSFAQDRTALGLARIEAHYFAHGLFLPPEGLLGNMDRHRPHSGGDRAGPLRHDLPGAHRVRAGRGVAGGAADDRAGCRAFRAGTGHPSRAGRGGGTLSPRAVSAAGRRKETAMKVGVIGLGTMGMGAALNLHRKGHPVTGCEVREAARAEFAAGGPRAVASADRPADGPRRGRGVRHQRRADRAGAVRRARLSGAAEPGCGDPVLRHHRAGGGAGAGHAHHRRPGS